MPVTEQERALYYQLRDKGLEPEDAIAKARETIAARKPSKTESAVRGFAQGGSFGFGDELAGAMGAAAGTLGILDNKEGLSVGDQYRQYRDEARLADKESEDANPGSYVAGQLAGGVATAPILPGGAASALGRAALTGAGYGAVSGVGASSADLTRGDTGGALRDAAIGATVGAATGAAVHGAVKGAKSLWRKVRPGPVDQSVAQSVAASKAAPPAQAGKVPEAPLTKKAGKAIVAEAEKAAGAANRTSSIGGGQSVATTFDESRELQRWAKSQGEDLALFPDQMTGTRSLALARRRSGQFDPTMDAQQALEAEQLRTGTRLTNKMIDHVAADPSRLGSPELMRSVGEAVKREGKAMHAARTADAGPLYDAAERLGGGVNADGIMSAIRGEISPFKAKGLQGQLAGLLGEVEKRGAGGGMSIKEANEIRKIMGNVIRGEDSFLDGVDMDVQGKIARRILGSVDGAFDAAEASGGASGKAVQYLRAGNAKWREHSQKIDGVLTDAVELVTRKSATDAAESIPARMAKMHPAQIKGIFQIVHKQSPGDASDLLASMLEDALVSGGKPARGAVIAEQEGIQRLSPAGVRKALEKIEPLLHAAAPDGKARMMVTHMYRLHDRLAHGPNIQGSDTAPKAYGPVKDLVRKGVGLMSGMAGEAIDQATMLADKITKSHQGIAEALSTRAGLEATNAALELLIAQQRGNVPPALARRLIDSAGRAGLLSAPRTAAEQVTGRIPPSPMAETEDDEQQSRRYAEGAR